jgi:hypothetical protein
MTLQTMSFIFGALLLAVGILGGGFEVKELKVANVTTTVRIVAAIVGVAFVGLGFWQPGAALLPAPAATSPPAAVAAAMGPREQDKDRYGGDFLGFDVDTARIELCEDACRNDGRCQAWTYVKPGLHGAQARCYLKSVVPALSDNACCVSGTKARR